MVFIGLSTQNAIYVNYFNYTKEQMKIYISSIFLLILGSTLVTLVGLTLFLEELSLWLEIPSLWLFLAVIYVFTQTVSSLLTILWVLEEKAFVFGLYQISKTLVLVVLALVLIIEFNFTWIGQLSAMLASSILFSVVSIVILWEKEYLKFVWSKVDIIDALKFGVPLIPHKLGEWVKLSSDKILLVALVGSAATGLYSVGYQIVSVIIILSVSIQKAWQPYLFKQLSNISSLQDKKKLVKITYILFLVMALVSGIIYLLAPYMIRYFLDVKFIGAIEFIGYLSLTNFFITINHTLISYIYYTKNTTILAKITMITAIFHFTLSYIFIENNGYEEIYAI